MFRSAVFIVFPALVALPAALGAQGITNAVPAVIGFVDLSMSGGTPVTPPPGDEGEHNIVTTIGNLLFPAGNVRIADNGVAIAGITTGEISFFNHPILPTGTPTIPGNGIICAFWDDLDADLDGDPPGVLPTSIMWKEDAGVLYIMWKNEYAYYHPGNGQAITFEIQVFGTPAPGQPWIQILYPDTFFAAPLTGLNHGAAATVGYAAGTNPFGINLPWSFDTASVPDGTVLSIFQEDLLIVPTSPAGPGSIRLDILMGPPSGTYFLAATTAGGAYPNGWFFGLDIPYGDLLAQASLGFPFVGPLDSSGAFTLGPWPGLPNGLTVYAVALGFPPGSPVPTEISAAISYAIP